MTEQEQLSPNLCDLMDTMKDGDFKLRDEPTTEEDPFTKALMSLQAKVNKLDIAKKFNSDLEMMLSSIHIVKAMNLASDNDLAVLLAPDIDRLASEFDSILTKIRTEMQK